MTWSLYSAWNLVWGWFGIANAIGVAAIILALYVPPLPFFLSRFSSNLRVIAIYVAIGAFSFSAVAGKFYHDGLAVKQHEWDAAVVAQSKKVGKAVERARDDANAGGLSDRYDRDDN